MRYACVLSLVAALACHVGPSIHKFEPAASAHGVQAYLRLGKHGTKVEGELLAVRDSTLLVLRDGERVVVAPIRLIRSARFEKLDMLMEGNRLSARDRERLRLFSRFPSGLTPELEAQLLAVYGQTAADQVDVR
jgi:hypothetical protein